MTPEQQGVLQAVADLVGRTGAADFSIEHHEVEQGGMTSWLCYVRYQRGAWEVCAAPDPATAAVRLAEALVDGGQCAHCGRPTAVDVNWLNPLPSGADAPWCAYVYDPSTRRFVRGCA